MDDLRYPVGKFAFDGGLGQAGRDKAVSDIGEAPGRLRAAILGLSQEQLDTPYRPSGWTGRQVVHHLADSHANASVRFRLALTEERPTIKPYDERAWAELVDAKTGPVEVSLSLLDALHVRLVVLLRSLDELGWQRAFVHPDRGPMTLEHTAGLYAWHGRHHVAHITALRQRNGW
jgi:hypothetical protein